ncbi:MAG TPA: iron-sulfur cluster assembly scaffold protein [Rubrobacteraceae bacterium]|nr:iron-sulfur cluster assembly scaffold protein [Rubrobacteraceae bacterium]
MDRKERIAFLVEHFKDPRHKGVLEVADVAMPGGSPECGGSVVVYLKGDGNGGIEALSWTGQGDTISMGATSVIVERVLGEKMGLDQTLSLDYDEFVESLGRDVIGSRTRNATLGLSTIKSAIRKYQRDRRSQPAEAARSGG